MTGTGPEATHEDEPHRANLSARLNWLRAGILGPNDGIVSVAAIVVGVPGATAGTGTVLTAGVAALVGGTVSMALGEYVSVSSQRDSQRDLIAKERRELAEQPEKELAELTALYEQKALTAETARRVAEELTEQDVLAAHLAVELYIDEDDVVSPWHAAFAPAVSFALGAVLSLIGILLPPEPWRVPVTFVVVLVALAVTGALGARIGGALALAFTFFIGRLLGASGIV